MTANDALEQIDAGYDDRRWMITIDYGADPLIYLEQVEVIREDGSQVSIVNAKGQVELAVSKSSEFRVIRKSRSESILAGLELLQKKLCASVQREMEAARALRAHRSFVREVNDAMALLCAQLGEGAGDGAR